MLPIEQREELGSEKSDYQNGVFSSEEEMKQSLSKLCNGDLYVIGRIYIEALKTVLVGSNFCLIPVVKADKLPQPPQKPPPMKYEDLPIYNSPHYEYKDYLEGKEKCPEARVKLIHRYLYPRVRQARHEAGKQLAEARCALNNACKNLCCSINDTKRGIKKYMRDSENLPLRQGVVAAGAAAGYLLGSGGGVPRRLLCTSLGGLAAGALCFPKETDDLFRNSLYHGTNVFLTFYNKLCKKNISLRERLPCAEDIPDPPPERKPYCPVKK